MPDVKLVILVDRDKRKAIDEVAAALCKVGLTVDRTLSITGVICGTAAAETVDALRKVEGVAQLREEEIFSLPPMDENIPQ